MAGITYFDIIYIIKSLIAFALISIYCSDVIRVT